MPDIPRFPTVAVGAALAAILASLIHEEQKQQRRYERWESPSDPQTIGFDRDPGAVEAQWSYGPGGGRRKPRRRGAE